MNDINKCCDKLASKNNNVSLIKNELKKYSHIDDSVIETFSDEEKSIIEIFPLKTQSNVAMYWNYFLLRTLILTLLFANNL